MGAASWTAIVPSGTMIAVQTRGGDTATPRGSRSGWSSVRNGGPVATPGARYLQYRVILSTTDAPLTPMLIAISFNWS